MFKHGEILVKENTDEYHKLRAERRQNLIESPTDNNNDSLMHNPYDYIENSNIQCLAKSLRWPSERLLLHLRRQGVLKSKNDRLTEDEYKVIKDLAENRCIEITSIKFVIDNDRRQWYENYEGKGLSGIVQLPLALRKQNAIMRGGNSRRSENVFDKIAKNGIGKLIYIRSR